MEALSGVDKHDWIRAKNDEMKALTENSTWVLTTLPSWAVDKNLNICSLENIFDFLAL
jgi:hypothetical protein